MEGDAVRDHHVVRTVHDQGEAGIREHGRMGREVGAGHLAVAVTAAIRVMEGIAGITTLAIGVITDHGTDAGVVVVVVIAPGARSVGQVVLMMMSGCRPMQMEADGGGHGRQDRHRHQQMTDP